MRRALERVTQRLQEFIAQRDDLALVLGAPQAESALVLKILEMLQDASSSEVFWVFTDAFTGPEAYAAAIIDSFAVRQEAVRLLQIKDGIQPWPELSKDLRNPRWRAVDRVRELMRFARSLLPPAEGTLVVWALFPLEISDTAGYLALVRDVLKHEFPFPWCHHIRIILRDDAAHPVLAPAFGGQRRIACYQPDLSPQALEESLNEEADDQNVPLEQRLQSVLVSAGMDYSHKRYAQAIEKYQLLFKYFASKGNMALAALALNGMGEIHVAQRKNAEAAECFMAALLPASEGNTPPLPVLTNVVLNLANLRVSEKKWPEAESYFHELQKLATIQRNPQLKVFAIEQLGQSQYEQGKVPVALESWTAADTVAGQLKLHKQRKSVLERMRRHYDRVGAGSESRRVEGELATVGQSIREDS